MKEGQQQIEKVQTPYVCFLDCDDIWKENKIADQLEMIEKDNYPLIYSGIDYIDLKGKKMGSYTPKYNSGFILPDLLLQFDINMVTPMLQVDFLRENKLNFSSQMQASEEFNLFMKIAALAEIGVMHKTHGEYRINEDSLTNKFSNRWHSEREQTIDELLELDPEIGNQIQK